MNKQYYLVTLRTLIATVVTAVGVGFLLVSLMFGDALTKASSCSIGAAIEEVSEVCSDPGTQWGVFICLGVYFVGFVWLRVYQCRPVSWVETFEESDIAGKNGPHSGTQTYNLCCNTNFWLVCVMAMSAIHYAFHHSTSTDSLVLLGGVGAGQWSAVLTSFKSDNEREPRWLEMFIVALLTGTLAAASVWMASGPFFEYRNQARWCGPWDNPNIFGMLMGTGVALAASQFIRSLTWCDEVNRRETSEVIGQEGEARNWKLSVCRCTAAILCFFSTISMTRGLLHSYSRGAWLGAAFGLVYLIANLGFRSQNLQFKWPFGMVCVSRLKRSWISTITIMICVFVLFFWHFRGTNWHAAQRAFATVNAADFSWRNRLAAWQGALQIVTEHPWLGAGWNQPKPLYEHYYLPSKLIESVAIEMNDYLMLGATLGIPALFCFGLYLWLNLVKSAKRKVRNDPRDLELSWLQTTCHAGAIVLLVGFWFDGGLFKLPTAATFWLLLELGSVGSRETPELHEND